jgi:hypothetical protein
MHITCIVYHLQHINFDKNIVHYIILIINLITVIAIGDSFLIHTIVVQIYYAVDFLNGNIVITSLVHTAGAQVSRRYTTHEEI